MNLQHTMTEALARLAPGAEKFLVAVSGGADSVAAVSLLHEAGVPLVVAHLDHGLRDQSGEDAAFVAALAAELGVEWLTDRVDVGRVASGRGWNIEDAARRVRYDFLHRAAVSRGCDAIVVAHTRDDQAETFLLQALRGSAYPSGMPARRGMVIRPLLDVPGAALLQHLVSLGRAWREDASNLDVGRSRAWLRHEVMPLLAERFPQVAARLARTAAGLGEAKTALDDVAAALFAGDSLRVAALARSQRAVSRAALVALLEREEVAPNAELVDAIVSA
ncbi:MAG TPA: tRNA lysidine(34) synthetase TilS, partial [Trueperaceae bacterium]|nr:tRNA lysidine(34) synthetase TilS [Trueperaceae bacterium]